MRRGGRGYNFQAPWRRRDDPTQSSIPFEQAEARRFRRLVALVAFSICISIIIWHSRLHTPIRRSRKPGFVFPLYSYYYRQLPNASDDLEGGSSAANGRRLREVSHTFFKLREAFYVTMKLGVPPQEFNFHIDTGSRHTWVYCRVSGHRTKIATLGPHGLFKPARGSTLRCIGESFTICKELQNLKQPCNSDNSYECLLLATYADLSVYRGVFITETITLPMADKSEVNVRSLMSCVTLKQRKNEQFPLLTDGIFGLGNCKKTLVDQWFERNVISEHVIGFCIEKALQPELSSTGAPIGFISAGLDFKEKFEQSNPAWAQLTQPPSRVHCAYTSNLLFVAFQDEVFLTQNDKRIGIPILFDTGSDKTWLASDIYDPVMDSINLYATDRGYIGVEDDLEITKKERRTCWRPPSKARKSDKGKVTSPLDDFPLLKFGIEGVPEASDDELILYLIIQPINYLEWEADEKRLCVDIIKDSGKYPINNFGANMLREHLFVFDYPNQRVRWQPDTCELE